MNEPATLAGQETPQRGPSRFPLRAEIGQSECEKSWNEWFALLHSIDVPEDFMEARPMNVVSRECGMFDEVPTRNGKHGV
ncbi:MAG: hypothetical protein HQM03_10050 [Magnetococcales bacterium]|nr:hypothetical protein [Magnetococcales bacterium]